MRKSVKDCGLDRWMIWSAVTEAFTLSDKLSYQELSELVSGEIKFSHDWAQQLRNAGYIQLVGQKGSKKSYYTLSKACPKLYDESLSELPRDMGYSISLISRAKKKTVQEIMEEVPQHGGPQIPSYLYSKDKASRLEEEVAVLKQQMEILQQVNSELRNTVTKHQQVMDAMRCLLKALLSE